MRRKKHSNSKFENSKRLVNNLGWWALKFKRPPPQVNLIMSFQISDAMTLKDFL